MGRQVEIEVTAEDIRDGSIGDSEFCPVARAIEREFPGKFVAVGDNSSRVGRWEFPNPPEVRKFLKLFDDGLEPLPFRFILKIPVEDAPSRGPCARCVGTGEIWHHYHPDHRGPDRRWAEPCPSCVQEQLCPRCGGELDGYCEWPAAACGWPD